VFFGYHVIATWKRRQLAGAFARLPLLLRWSFSRINSLWGSCALVFEPKAPMYKHSSDGRFVGALVTWVLFEIVRRKETWPFRAVSWICRIS